MKKNISPLSLLFLLCVAALCGCTDDDDPISVTDGTPLTIHATADGFTSTDGVNTRAMENGYTTTFTTGDAIGVFAVDKNGAVIADCKNVKCTYSADGSWTAESSAPVYYYTGAQYFAYYPYKSELSAENITEVSGIVDYFNKNIATDQSTYAKYTACDLMTTTQNVSPTTSGGNKSLSFSFTHRMSLIEISLPMQKYKTSEDADAYEYSSRILSGTFSIVPGTANEGASSITPCSMGNGVYRCIIPANTSYKVGGEFSAGDKTIEYSKEDLSLSAGNYQRLNVTYSGAPIVRALAVGDFYCKDAISGTGYLIPGDITELTEEQKAACLGIVMKVGRGTNEGTTGNEDKDAKKWTDTDTYMLKGTTTKMSTIHGYVLALKDGNGGSACAWASFNTQIGTDQSQYTLFCGYSNMQTIKTYLSKNSDKRSLQTDFPAAYHASEGYETIESGKYSSPSNSSGWFLPSAGQCWYWYKNKDLLEESMKKAERDGWYQYYWSSSEDGYYPVGDAWYVNFNDGSVYYNNKNYRNCRVRSCLAF